MSLNEGSKDHSQDLKDKLNEAKDAGIETKKIVSLLRSKIEGILENQNNSDNSSGIDSKNTEKSPEKIKQVLDSLKQKIENQSSETDDYIFNQIHEELSNLVAINPESYQVLTQTLDQAVVDKNNRPILKFESVSLIKQKQREKEVAEKEKQGFKEMADQQYEKFKLEEDLILKSLEDQNLESQKAKLQGKITALEQNIALNFNEAQIKELYAVIRVLYTGMTEEEDSPILSKGMTKEEALKEFSPILSKGMPEEEALKEFSPILSKGMTEEALKEISLALTEKLINNKTSELEEMMPKDDLEKFNKIKETALEILRNIHSDREKIERLRQDISNLKPNPISDEEVLNYFLTTVDLADPGQKAKLQEFFKEQSKKETKEKNYPEIVLKICSRMVFDRDYLISDGWKKLYRESEKKISEMKNNFNGKQQDLLKKMDFQTYQQILGWGENRSDNPIKFNPRDINQNLSKDETLKNDPVKIRELENEIKALENEAKGLNEKITNEYNKMEDVQKNLSGRKPEELREQDIEAIVKMYETEIPEGKNEDLKEILKKELKYGWKKEAFSNFAKRLELNQNASYSGFSLETEINELGTELMSKIRNINDDKEKEGIINSWKEKIFDRCFKSETESTQGDETRKENLNKMLDAIVFFAKNGNLDLNQVNNSNYLKIEETFDYFSKSFDRPYYSEGKLKDAKAYGSTIKYLQNELLENNSVLEKFKLSDDELKNALNDSENIKREKTMFSNIVNNMSRPSGVDKKYLNEFVDKFNARFNASIKKAGFLRKPNQVIDDLKQAEASQKYEDQLSAIDKYNTGLYLRREIERFTKQKNQARDEFAKKVIDDFGHRLSHLEDQMYDLLSYDGRQKFNELKSELETRLRTIAREVADSDNMTNNNLLELVKGIKSHFTAPIQELVENEIYPSSRYKSDKEKAELIQIIKSVKSFKDLDKKEEEVK